MVVLLRGNDVKIEWRLTFSGELSDYSNGRLYVYCDSEDIDVPFQLVDNVLYATIAGNQLKVGVYSMVFISTGESQFLRKKVSKAFEITEDEQSVVEGVVIADSSAYGRTMYSLTDVLSNRDNDSVEGAKEGHVLTYTNGLWRGMPSRGGSGEGGGASTEYIDTAIQGIRDYIDGLIYLKDGTLFTDYPFASLKSIATKGIGSSSSGGGSSLVNVMQKWPTNWDGSYQSYALGAGLGWQLKEGISVNSESIEKALTRIVGLEDVSQQHNQAIGKITTIEKNYEDIKDELKGYAKLLDWFDIDSEGNVYTTFNFYSTQAISTKGVGSGSSGGGGGGASMLYQLYDVQANAEGNQVAGAVKGNVLTFNGKRWEGTTIEIPDVDFSEITKQIDVLAAEVSKKQDKGELDETLINYNNRINDNADNISKILKWFTLDEENEVLFTTYNLASEKSIATKGIGTSSGGGGNSYPRLDRWENYDAANGAVLSATLGYELYDKLLPVSKDFLTSLPQRLQQAEAGVDGVNMTLAAINDTLATHTEDIDTNEAAIKSINDKLTPIENAVNAIKNWFTLEDDTLITEYNLASKMSISTKGIGSSNGGGGNSYNRLDAWPSEWDDTYGLYVLGAGLGYELKNSIDALADADVYWNTIVGRPTKLSEFANDTQFITSDALSGLALKGDIDALDSRIDALENFNAHFQIVDGVILVDLPFASLGAISTKGIGDSNAGGGGVSYSRLDTWDGYTTDKAGYVLSAKLGWDLKTQLDNLDINDFDLSNYYTKENVNNLLRSKQDTINDLDAYAKTAAIQQWVIDQSYATTGQFEGITLTLSAHDARILANENNIIGVDDRLKKVEAWFTLEDDVLMTEHNLASSQSIATKGIGTSSGGGGVVPWSEIENSIIPKVTDTYSIGTNTNKWKSIYAIEGHFNTLVAHALNAESIKLNGKDVATKDYVIAMVAQGGGGGGTGGSSTVSYLPTIEEGKEIGTLIVDGVSYGLFAPSKYSWDDIDDIPNFAKVAFSGSYNDLSNLPTIPSIVGLASEVWVKNQLNGYQEKITTSNKLSYSLISGTPTSLKNPYSLKFGSKTYDGSSEISLTASDLGALTAHQAIYKLTIQKNGTEVGTFTPNSKNATINIDGVVTLSDEQEITGRKTFKGGVRLDSNTVIRNAQFIGTNASDAVLWKVDNTGNATFVNGVLGGTLSVTKESTFTGETTHNGGIVIPSGKTLKIGDIVIEEKDGGLFVNGDLAASGSVATKGVGSSSGGGGNSYGRLDNWDNYNASNGDVLSALLGYGLKNDIATLTSKFSNYFTKNETRNEIVAYLSDFNNELIAPIYSTKSEVGSLADVVGGIGSRVSTLEGKATAVSFAQTLQSGKQIGVLTIDDKPTTLFAPASYSWNEINSRPTKLSDFTDDVVSGKYLSLGGGTVKSSSGGALAIDRTGGGESYIKLLSGGTYKGAVSAGNATYGAGIYNAVCAKFMGIKDDGTPHYHGNTLIHGGNIGSQSVSYATNASALLTNNKSQNADACYNSSPGLHFYRYDGTGNTIGGGDGWILQWSWDIGSVGGQIYLDDNPTKIMGIRGYDSKTSTFTAWSNFLHSGNYTEYTVKKDGTGATGTWDINITGSAGNADTATKLSTARTIWGQSFDGSGDVSGHLHLGSGGDFEIGTGYSLSDTTRYNKIVIGSDYAGIKYYSGTWTGGNVIVHDFKVGVSETSAFIVNNVGNVTIGSSDLAGTDHKLYVDGKAILKVNNASAAALYAENTNGKISLQTHTNRGVYDNTKSVWLIGTDGLDTFLMDGNVGIGTLSPTEKLHVDGNSYVNGTLNASGITSAGAITIKDTVYGIGTTGVIRGSKVISEGAIETSTLKVGSILIEDKDGDLFVNGNLAASGSVATKGIGSSSSGGSATIPWSEVPMSILPANNTLYLGSNLKPWDRVFSSYFGTDNNHTIITGTSVNIVSDLYFSNGIDHIDTDGNAYLHSIYMDDELVATEAWVNTKLGAAASYGIGYVQSGNNGLVTGNSVYVALTSYDSDVLASKYATSANTYTKTQVNNNFAAKSEAMIDVSTTIVGSRSVKPTLTLTDGDSSWSMDVAKASGSNVAITKYCVYSESESLMELSQSGDMWLNGRLTQSSDETLKNILGYNVDMKVRDIANAPICYFTWKDRVSDRQIGTIAQYWKLITPECVIGKEGRMSMDYSTLGLVSSIINAREIVKHEDEIEALKKRVKELEDKLAAVSAA